MGLAIRKYTLAKQGIIAHSTLRKPGGGVTAKTMSEIDALAARQQKRLAEIGVAP